MGFRSGRHHATKCRIYNHETEAHVAGQRSASDMKTHIQITKKLVKHVASRGDHLGEICYFSTLAFLEHGTVSLFGFAALGFSIIHIAYTFNNEGK